MDAEKLAEAIIARIEHDRAIHKSSLVEEIQRAMNPSWVGSQTMPNMMQVLSDGTNIWTCAAAEITEVVIGTFDPTTCVVKIRR